MLVIFYSMYYKESYKSFTNVKAIQNDREKHYIITFKDGTSTKLLKHHWTLFSIDCEE